MLKPTGQYKTVEKKQHTQSIKDSKGIFELAFV